MRGRLPLATVRIDAGVIEVRAPRHLRSFTERRVIAPTATPESALADALTSSPLLPAGRRLRTEVVLETSRITFAVTTGVDDAPKMRTALPRELLEGLERAIARRRVRGPATLELGPLVRADDAAADAHVNVASEDRIGIIVDRSRAAVTVLLVGPHGLLWGRSAPADEPVLAARLLIDRARGQLPDHGALCWWRLHDVTSGDGSSDPRARRELAAAVSSEFDGIPLLPGRPA
jgi:hypothetical protein